MYSYLIDMKHCGQIGISEILNTTGCQRTDAQRKLRSKMWPYKFGLPKQITICPSTHHFLIPRTMAAFEPATVLALLKKLEPEELQRDFEIKWNAGVSGHNLAPCIEESPSNFPLLGSANKGTMEKQSGWRKTINQRRAAHLGRQRRPIRQLRLRQDDSSKGVKKGRTHISPRGPRLRTPFYPAVIRASEVQEQVP